MPASSSPAPRPLVGILFVVLATLIFGISDTITKHLAMLYPASVVLAARYIVNLAVIAAVFWPRQRAGLWQAQRLWLSLARGLCLVAASFSVALALRVMPLGETIAIIYIAPFAVMLLAIPLLGERVSALGWACAVLGFAGVLLIARPGGGLDPVGVVLALLNAAFSTAYHLLTRLLSRTETTASLLFHTAWVGAVIFGALALPELADFTAAPLDLWLMVLLGALIAAAHFLFTAAYREAPASLLAPVNYVHLVWAGGFGWLVFGHLPDALALVGMLMVTVAGIAIALTASRRRTAVLPEPPAPVA